MQPLNKFKSYLYTLNYYLSSDYDLFKIKISCIRQILSNVYSFGSKYWLTSVRHRSISKIYTRYIFWHWYIPGIYLVYTWYIPMHQNKIPGGWCCGGGQGPIPPVPPATTSPGIVMTLILSLPSLRQRGFLLLVMWVWRARFELKIAFTFHS